MGRPKKYATQAERQAAYRSRLAEGRGNIVVNRSIYERLITEVHRLHQAVRDAAGAGDIAAQRCLTAHTESCLEAVATLFEEKSKAPNDLNNRSRLVR